MAAAGGGGREDPTSEVGKQGRLAMMELANMISVPMALNAVVRLNVPDAIWQSGSNSPLTAAEILALLRPPPPSSSDPSVLQRLLRLLASHGVFAENRCATSGARRYSLTDVGRTLVPSGDGASYAAYVLQHHQDALVRAWPRLHEAVLDPAGPEPFARANGGVPAYAYYGGDREANALMQRAMWGVSEPFMEALLDGYGSAGFGSVETLVDVGGSSGACLDMIMRRFPSVKRGINFDLPEVVAEAPPLAGSPLTHNPHALPAHLSRLIHPTLKWVGGGYRPVSRLLSAFTCYEIPSSHYSYVHIRRCVIGRTWGAHKTGHVLCWAMVSGFCRLCRSVGC